MKKPVISMALEFKMPM